MPNPGPEGLCKQTECDAGTNCLSRSPTPGPDLKTTAVGVLTVCEEPSVLETLRQHAVIGAILGIRQGIATVTSIVNPLGTQAVQKDQVAAQQLLAKGNYERAFEVATGFAEYFDIKKQGKEINSPTTETLAVMMGYATGFNQAVETVTGESRSGDSLSGFDRVATGLDALSRIASTAMTVAGGVGVGAQSLGLGSTAKIVSPVYRLAGRDIVIVETSVGRQAFYRSTGANSGSPGTWFPVDEVRPVDGWFNKAAYTQGPGLHRLGTTEFARISESLGKRSIPKGQQVPAGKSEIAEVTLNRILDFFGARITPTTMNRPVAK